MNRHHSYTQQKYALIAMLLVILYCLLFSCKIKPDGKDEKGWYKDTETCVSYHDETVWEYHYGLSFRGKMEWHYGPNSKSICDEYQTVRKYIKKNRVDSSKYEKTPTK